jgi:hypothetical protein
MASGLDLGHVGLLIRTHAKYAIRGGSGMSYVLIVIVVGLIVASVLVDPLDAIRQDYERRTGQKIPADTFMEKTLDALSGFVAYWLDAPQSETDTGSAPVMSPPVAHLLKHRPGLLSVMFLILIALEPFMVAFGGFNQLSGDIANRGLRYMLLRTSRLNVILSRFIGTFVFSAVTSFFTIAVVVTYIAIRFDAYSTGALAAWGLWGWAAINIFSLPYFALCLWISTTIASPFAALALAQLATGLPIVVIKLVKARAHGSVEWLDRITPWGWKFDLVHPDAMKVFVAILVMLGFFLLFFLLATRHFLRRDL